MRFKETSENELYLPGTKSDCMNFSTSLSGRRFLDEVESVRSRAVGLG